VEQQAVISGEDRRREPRAHTSLTADLTTDGEHLPGLIRDVSATGVLVEASEELPLGLTCQLTFTAFGQEYAAGLEVLRRVEQEGARLYGCRLLLTEHASEQFKFAVRAALGVSATWVRSWDDLQQEVQHPDAEQLVVVGHTPSGKTIKLSPRDCLDMGPEGIELFVRTVGDIETM
jgi:hypothetical protein